MSLRRDRSRDLSSKTKPRGIPGRREEKSNGAEAGPLQVDEQVMQGCSIQAAGHR